MEKELLIIVESLKYFKNILLGQLLKIYTNNKNITSKTFKYRQSIKMETYTGRVQYRDRIYPR